MREALPLRRAVWVLSCGVALATGCNRGSSGDAPPSGSATTTGAASTTGAAGGSADLCSLQPYRRRCDPACKSAHAAAVSGACAAETSAFTKAVENQLEMGKCLVACRKPGSDSSCVGAEDRAGCECQVGCYRTLPADAQEKARATQRCYAKAVAAACE